MTTTPRAHGARRRRHLTGLRVPFWFVLPALVLYVAIVLVPSLIGAGYSFTDSEIGDAGDFVGFDNFARVVTDAASLGPLTQTIAMAAGIMVAQNVIGLLLALALNTEIRSRNFLRVLFFTPFVISPLVAGFLWKYILGTQGPFNNVLEAIGLSALTQPWLGQGTTALIALIVTVAWQFTGSTMVIYLAGLQGVPSDVIEAASLDGATGPRRFWYITRAFLAPAFTVNLTLSLIGGLKIYDQIQAMTSGGPGGATDSVSTVIYRIAFQFGQFGYGAALAVVLTLLVVVLTAIQYLGLRRQARA